MSKLSEFLSLYAKTNTVKQYKINLKQFFCSVYGEGDVEDQAERYISETRDREADLKNFYTTIKDRPPKTIMALLSTVKSFLINNRIELSELLWRQLAQLRNHRSKAITDDRAPTKAELREIINNLPLISKALYVVLESSGMRIGEACQIKIDDIDLASNPAKIRIQADYTKTGTKRITFITSEAKEFVLQWLKQRDSYLKTAHARVTHSDKGEFRDKAGQPIQRPEYKHEFKGKPIEDDRLFPIDYATAKIMWLHAIKKSGLAKMDKTTKRYSLRPHSLRKFFRTNFSDKDIAEALMGHEAFLSEAYRRYSEEQLAEIYLKNEGSLLIFGNPDQMSKLSEQANRTEERVKHLIDENLELKERLRKVEEFMSKWTTEIKPEHLQEAYQKTLKEEIEENPAESIPISDRTIMATKQSTKKNQVKPKLR